MTPAGKKWIQTSGTYTLGNGQQAPTKVIVKFYKKGPNNQLTYVGQTDCNNPANGQYTCTEVTLDQNEEYLAISFWVEANNQQHSSGTAEFSTSVMP